MGGVRVTAGRAVFSPPSLFSLAFSFSLFLSHLFTHSHARSLSVFDERLKKKNYAKPKTWLHSSPLKVFRFSWLVFYRSTPLVVLSRRTFYSRPPSASLSAGFRASGHWKKKKKSDGFLSAAAAKQQRQVTFLMALKSPWMPGLRRPEERGNLIRARLSSFLSARLESPA